MDTPESKRDARLSDLGLEPDLLADFADMPVAALDLPFETLDLPDVVDVEATPPTKEPETEPPRASVSGKSVRISIRIPLAVLEKFKSRAADSGKGYQTLMVRALREWGA